MKRGFVIDMDGMDKKYEYVIKSIYPTLREARLNGGSSLHMKNLVYTYSGHGNPGLPSYEDQFKKVLQSLISAVDMLLRQDISLKQHKAAIRVKANLNQSVSLGDLYKAINQMVEIIDGKL